MNWMALLNFCYNHLWGTLILAVILLVVTFVGGILVALVTELKSVIFSLLLTVLLAFVGFACRIAFILWAIMLVVNAGHWIGMY